LDSAKGKTMNVSEYLIGFINSLNIDTVYGVSGGRIEHFLHSIHASAGPVSLVTAKHEFSAAAMADSYAQSGKAMGVIATTSGGAALNIVPALGEAYTEKSPVLVLAGQPENNRELHGAFQETSGQNGTPDLAAILGCVSRYCKILKTPEELPRILSEICQQLVINREGPAVLMIPQNLFARPVEVPLPVIPSPVSAKPGTMMNKASLPAGPFTIVAGSGVSAQKAETGLQALAEKLGCPVVTTPDGKSAFDNFSPLYAGSIGIMGNPSAFEAVKEAAALIVAGAKLNEIDLYGIEDAEKNILILGKPPLFKGTFYHVSESVESACEFLKRHLQTVKTEKQPGLSFSNKAANPYVRMLKVIEREIGPDMNIAVDAGVTGAYALHNLRVKSTNSFRIALGMAGMGYSFGSIIGTVKANGHKGILIAGDGSFYMNGFEIHTALEMKLPIIYIIFNNNGHKMCSYRESGFFQKLSGDNDFTAANPGSGFDKMFPGLPSCDVNCTEELEKVFKDISLSNGPVLISINIDDRIGDNDPPPYLPLYKGDAKT
jgi:acetolactate synthase-1/2/3 large subunit